MSLQEIGEQLRQRREELGISLQDVQEATKIRLRYLRALEAGDDSNMPGYAYARGFLRLYASYLSLDAEALVEQYRNAKEGSRTAETRGRRVQRRSRSLWQQRRRRPVPGAEGRPTPRWRRSNLAAESNLPPGTTIDAARTSRRLARMRRGTVLTALLVIALLATAITAGYFVYVAAQQQVDNTASDSNADRTAQVGTEPESPPPESPSDDAAAENPTGNGQAGTNLADNDDSETALPSAVEVQAQGQTIHYAVGSTPIRVTLQVEQRCWVRVEADGQLLEEQTLQPGTEKSWQAAESLRIRAGNPAGIKVIVNAVDLGIPDQVGPRTLVFEPAD